MSAFPGENSSEECPCTVSAFSAVLVETFGSDLCHRKSVFSLENMLYTCSGQGQLCAWRAEDRAGWWRAGIPSSSSCQPL